MSKIVIVVVSVYIVGLFFTLTQGAHWGFYLYQVVYYLNPENRWWSSSLPSFGYSKVTVLAFMLMYATQFSRYKKNAISSIPYLKWLIFFLISYGLIYIYAIGREYHEKALIDFFKLFIILGFAYKVIDDKKKLEGSLLAFLVGATYIGYEAYVVGRNSSGRVEGIGMIDAPEANGTAAAIVGALPILVFYFWKGGKYIRVASVIMGGLIVNGLILINSRGALVGGFVGVSYFMLEMYRSVFMTKYQKLLVIFMVIIGLTGLFALADESFINRMDTLSNVDDESASGSHRVRLWIIGVEMAIDYPFGLGAYGYNLLSPEYVPEHLFGTARLKSVHSIWVQALTEVGWHGFFFFLMILWTVFKMAKKIKIKCKAEGDSYNYYLTHAVLSAYLSVLTACTFINQFRVQIVYWMILFITCLYSIIILNGGHDKKNDDANHS